MFVFSFKIFHGQLQSPAHFLGYEIGTLYTPYNKVVDYFNYVAQQVPQFVRLQKYGESNEGRPLYLAFVSSENNIKSLESIRINNLRLAKQAKDNIEGSLIAPSIVWLSYNVHGNETSSTEAALMALYTLASPMNSEIKEWLQNTVVVIDPCLNPDGRERYINWYTTVLGSNANPLAYAREHKEPWPGGRSNHYYFDLNRDWAWQTQIESQHRAKQYNSWLPQVHVDYHEQGYNEPYYFAPAAEPYHDVITDWQREFQKTIGRNNAKYFDKSGWLYFTKERFDLLYPSYGDTYPTYNGAVGMTYEQGGIRAGLSIITGEGDTLTLMDRVKHHLVTSLSTIEIASKNSKELVNQFKQYFNVSHSGVYKSYILKNKPEDKYRIEAVKKFFDKNNIQWGSSNSNTNVTGYDYETGKTVSFLVEKDDIIVDGNQAKSALIRVLFDPNPKLVDSMTYDITSWALPYAYGIKGYASKQTVLYNNNFSEPKFIKNEYNDSYAYVIRWNGVPAASALAQLLQLGIRTRTSESSFSISGESYPAGSVIISKNGNEKLGSALWKKVATVCDSFKVTMNAVNTGMVDKGFDFGSPRVRMLKPPKVVLLTGKGVSANAVGDLWYFMDKELQYPATLIDADDINHLNWNEFDVLIIADGKYAFLEDTTNDKLSEWVKNGGRLIAFENAVAQLTKQHWSAIRLKSESKKSDSSSTKDRSRTINYYEKRERDELQNEIPGTIVKVELDTTHPLMFGYPKYYYSLKSDKNLYDFIKKGGWNVGVIKKPIFYSGFIGSKVKQKLGDSLIFGVQQYGKGSIVYLTDNVLFRNFWENGKLMFCNALFLVE